MGRGDFGVFCFLAGWVLILGVDEGLGSVFFETDFFVGRKRRFFLIWLGMWGLVFIGVGAGEVGLVLFCDRVTVKNYHSDRVRKTNPLYYRHWRGV